MRTMPMPQSIGSFGFRQRGGFIVALRDGLWLATDEGRLTKNIADAPFAQSTHRFNDVRCDRQGRFWDGSMNERRDANSGALQRLDADGTLTEVFDDMMI